MDELWKWIAVGAAVLLLAFVIAGEKEAVVKKGNLIESGQFVIEQGGTKLGQEKFSLWQEEGGYMLDSSIWLEVGKQIVDLNQHLKLTEKWSPTTYLLKGETPQGKQWVKANIEDGEVNLEFLTNDKTQKRKLTGQPPFVIFDNNIVSHSLLLYKIIRASEQAGEEFSGTALVPQVASVFPIRAGSPKSAAIKSGDKTIPVQEYPVQFGDYQIALYGQERTFFGYKIAAQKALAYRGDLLPDGMEVMAEEEKEKKVQLPEGVKEEELIFTSNDLKLAGTLTLPKGAESPVPAVLMIHGSGPVDRNGNAPGLKLDLFNTVAYRLAQAGIASFRYDKRGVGESEGVFSKASMQDLLKDAKAALQFLKNRQGVDSHEVYALGHSEGGILAPILAADDLINGLILLAAPAHPLDWILIEQTRLIYQASGADQDELKKQVERARQFTEFVKKTEGDWKDSTLEQIREYLPWMTEEELPGYKQMSLSWWRQHFARHPLETIRKIKVPVLIIQGEKDLQVPKGEAELLAQALKEAGNQSVKLEILPDLNHLMRHHPEDPNMSYRHLDEPVDERVLNLVTDWAAIQAAKKKESAHLVGASTG